MNIITLFCVPLSLLLRNNYFDMTIKTPLLMITRRFMSLRAFAAVAHLLRGCRHYYVSSCHAITKAVLNCLLKTPLEPFLSVIMFGAW